MPSPFYFRDDLVHLQFLQRERIVGPDALYRMNRLERVLPWPEKFKADLSVRLAQVPLHRYPDFPAFYARLSAFVGVPSNQLVVGYGIDEFIKSLIWLCCKPGEAIGMIWPSYRMYDVYCKIFSVELKPIIPQRVGNGKGFNTGSVFQGLWDLVPQVRAIFLVNPGQPIETHFDLGAIGSLAKRCAEYGTLLIVDEAYHGFGAVSAIPLVKQFDNLIVLRTFSKAMGLAAIRFGFAVGNPETIKPIHAIRMAGENTGLSLAAAEFVMDRYESEIVPYITEVRLGRGWLCVMLLDLAWYYVRGYYGNHLLVDLESSRKRNSVAAYLRRDEIHVGTPTSPPCETSIIITCAPQTPIMEHVYSVLLKAMQDT